jgi:hypothetical protein
MGRAAGGCLPSSSNDFPARHLGDGMCFGASSRRRCRTTIIRRYGPASVRALVCSIAPPLLPDEWSAARRCLRHVQQAWTAADGKADGKGRMRPCGAVGIARSPCPEPSQTRTLKLCNLTLLSAGCGLRRGHTQTQSSLNAKLRNRRAHATLRINRGLQRQTNVQA